MAQAGAQVMAAAAAAGAARRRALAVVALGLLALAAVYHETLASMARIWWRSETFAHGFLIFPISAWLVWRQRATLARLPVAPDWRALAALALLAAGWLAARQADILVGEQLAFVLMVPALVWLAAGAAVVRRLAFPLGFLVFAVPMGEALVPPMMDFTADFTVALLRLTGIPVYQEGTFFSIPTGDWSVVEGCSGVRYLIASVTLGTLYAYLTYRAFWRRALMVALSALVPIVANGLRAYMIVMIAHLSDMKLALGVDHFIYGWVFFGIVMFLLFWLGTLWQERDAPPAPPAAPARACRVAPAARLLAAAAAGLVVLGTGPATAAWLDRSVRAAVAPPLALPARLGPWQATDEFTAFAPRYVGPLLTVRRAYTDGGAPVLVHLAWYSGQRQGAELASSANVLVPQKHPVWRQPWERDAEGAGLTVREALLRSTAGETLLAWRLMWVDGRYVSRPLEAKLLEAWAALRGRRRDGAGVVLLTPAGEDLGEARARLAAFLGELRGPLGTLLARAAGEGGP